MIPKSVVFLFLLLEACSSSGSSGGDDTDGGTGTGTFDKDSGKPTNEPAPDGAPAGCVYRGLGPLQAKTAVSSGEGAPWINPEGAIVKDDQVAIVDLDGKDSQELILTDYGFDVPANATIIGFELQFNRQAEGADVLDDEIHVIAGGVKSPTKKFFGPTWPKSAEGEHIYGNEADDWGFQFGLKGSVIDGKDFGVSIKVKRADGTTAAKAKINQARLSVLFCL